MREIKFRVWDKEVRRIETWEMLKNCNKEWLINVIDGQLTNDYELMQFTGLEDKKGKEIYEGDILIEGYSEDDLVVFEIVWIDIDDAGYSVIKGIDPNCVLHDIRLSRSDLRHTIIGNRYENPEMIKKSYWTKKRFGEWFLKVKNKEQDDCEQKEEKMEGRLYEFIQIVNLSDAFPEKKTQTFEVRNIFADVRLGWIKWISSYRKYGFFPEPNTYYEEVCLTHITEFLEALIKERKDAK